MNLQELEQKSGFSNRQLRYCLDHQLLPPVKITTAEDKPGRPREFKTDVAVWICCAASLVELGLPHDAIRHFLKTLHAQKTVWHEKSRRVIAYLARARTSGPPDPTGATAQLSSARYVRLRVPGLKYDSGWIAPPGLPPVSEDCQPGSAAVLDLAAILDRVRGGRRF